MRCPQSMKNTPAAFLALCVLLLSLGACSTYKVTPPPPPERPQPVFLLDFGDHAGLVLPWKKALYRFDYGDWEWYARQNTGLAAGFRAVIGSSPSALGRQVLSAPATERNIRAQLLVVIEELYVIPCEQERVAHLAEKLNTIFEENITTLHVNPGSSQHFVRHPVPYSLARNSNSMVAVWLEELGCTVTGGGIDSRWEIVSRSPEQDARSAAILP